MDNTNIGKISMSDVRSAVISAVIAGVVAILFSIVKGGDIFALDWKLVTNAGVIAMVASLLKNLSTDRFGNFAGITRVK